MEYVFTCYYKDYFSTIHCSEIGAVEKNSISYETQFLMDSDACTEWNDDFSLSIPYAHELSSKWENNGVWKRTKNLVFG